MITSMGKWKADKDRIIAKPGLKLDDYKFEGLQTSKGDLS